MNHYDSSFSSSCSFPLVMWPHSLERINKQLSQNKSSKKQNKTNKQTFDMCRTDCSNRSTLLLAKQWFHWSESETAARLSMGSLGLGNVSYNYTTSPPKPATHRVLCTTIGSTKGNVKPVQLIEIAYKRFISITSFSSKKCLVGSFSVGFVTIFKTTGQLKVVKPIL